MDRISLEGMIFYGHHGTHRAETELGQRFVVDLHLYGDFEEAGISDDLDRAVNYAEVYGRAKAIVEGEPRRLLEAVARALCGDILEKFERVEKVTVRIRKPHVPIPASLACASVRMTRVRAKP